MEDGEADAAYDFLESSPYAQIAFDFDLVILAVNARHCALTGVTPEAQLGRGMFEVYATDPHRPDASAEKPLRASVERVRETGLVDVMDPVSHDLPRPGRPGEFEARHWQLTHSPLRGPGGRVVGVLQTTQDVTAAAVERQRAAARRRSAESAGTMQFFEIDLTTGRSTRSVYGDRLYGFDPQADERSFTQLLERIHPEDRAAVVDAWKDAQAAEPGDAFELEYRTLRPDGGISHITSMSEVVAGADGLKLTGVTVDTTAIHRREESLRRMVEEKQALLADVNHRVKNSLQLVSSLLRIEERSALGGPVAGSIRVTAGRVAAIAAVHSSLYHHADVSRVNVSEHLRRFCGQIADDNDGRLVLRLEDEPLYLAAEKAVPLALLVNELVADALAVDGEAGGRVVLRLEYHGTALLLRVENGVTTRPRKPGPLGSRLFDALLAQLGGTFRQDSSDGRNASIEFERS